MRVPAGLILCLTALIVSLLGSHAAAQLPTGEPPGPIPGSAVQAILNEALSHAQSNRLREALAAADRALTSAGMSNDVAGVAVVQRVRARLLEFSKRVPEAITAWRAVRDASKSLDDGPGQIQSLLAEAALTLPGPAKDQSRLIDEAVRLASRETRRPLAAARELFLPGVSYANLDMPLEAGRLFRAALEIRERLAPDSLELAQSLNSVGNLASDQGELETAQRYYERAVVIQEREAPRSPNLAITLFNLGNLAQRRRQPAEAIRYYLQALVIQQAVAPISAATANTLNNLGATAQTEISLEEARRYHQQALEIREQLESDSMDVSNSLFNLGSVELIQGDLASARSRLERSLAIRERLVPNSPEVASSLTNLANVLQLQGDLTRARAGFERALSIDQRSGQNSIIVADLLISLGNLARDQGDLAAASRHYERSLAMATQVAPDSPSEAGAVSGLGLIARDRGELPKAKAHFERALAIHQRLAPTSLDTAWVLNSLGAVALRLGDTTASRAHHERALALQEAVAPNSPQLATTLIGLGRVTSELGNGAGAREYLERAKGIYEKVAPGSLDLVRTHSDLGRIAASTGNFKSAGDSFRAAWELLRRQASSVRSMESRACFFESWAGIPRKLFTTELLLDNAAGALTVLEQGRGQALRDVIQARGVLTVGPRAALQSAWRQAFALQNAAMSRLARARSDEARLGRAVQEAEREGDMVRLASERNRLSAAEETSRRLLAEYTDLRLEAEGRYAALWKDVPALETGSDQIELARRSLPAGTLFLAFSSAENSTGLLAMEGGAGIRGYLLPIERKHLEERVRSIRRLCRASDPDRGTQVASPAEIWAGARRMFQALFPAMVREQILKADRLVISPDGPLWELPFAALVTNSGGNPAFLGLQKPLTFTHSLILYADSLRAPAGTAGTAAALVMGNPWFGVEVKRSAAQRPQAVKQVSASASRRAAGERGLLTRDGEAPAQLPHADTEARLVAARLGARAILYREATETAFRRLAPAAKVIHLATHGYADGRFPANGGVLLARGIRGTNDTESDGALQVWELLAGVRLQADLVVLSACETALGGETAGEGMVGLTYAFQQAGARSVAASLWKVDDASTGALMAAMYRHLAAGVRKDEAIRRAMAELATGKLDSRWRHPYHWAAFLLSGDPENHTFKPPRPGPGKR